jgi:hypothetical protein
LRVLTASRYWTFRSGKNVDHPERVDSEKTFRFFLNIIVKLAPKGFRNVQYEKNEKIFVQRVENFFHVEYILLSMVNMTIGGGVQ